MSSGLVRFGGLEEAWGADLDAAFTPEADAEVAALFDGSPWPRTDEEGRDETEVEFRGVGREGRRGGVR